MRTGIHEHKSASAPSPYLASSVKRTLVTHSVSHASRLLNTDMRGKLCAALSACVHSVCWSTTVCVSDALAGCASDWCLADGAGASVTACCCCCLAGLIGVLPGGGSTTASPHSLGTVHWVRALASVMTGRASDMTCEHTHTHTHTHAHTEVYTYTCMHMAKHRGQHTHTHARTRARAILDVLASCKLVITVCVCVSVCVTYQLVYCLNRLIRVNDAPVGLR